MLVKAQILKNCASFICFAHKCRKLLWAKGEWKDWRKMKIVITITIYYDHINKYNCIVSYVRFHRSYPWYNSACWPICRRFSRLLTALKKRFTLRLTHGRQVRSGDLGTRLLNFRSSPVYPIPGPNPSYFRIFGLRKYISEETELTISSFLCFMLLKKRKQRSKNANSTNSWKSLKKGARFAELCKKIKKMRAQSTSVCDSNCEQSELPIDLFEIWPPLISINLFS